ncbi:hypothetical protein MASR2M78_09010 [Treponema sp.]
MTQKTAVLFVTRTGHSRVLAQAIATKLGTEAYEIEDKVNRKGFLGYIKAGFQAAKKKASPIGDPLSDLSEIETVVLVQPIWASALIPPLRSWLQAHQGELKGKRVALATIRLGSPAEAIRKAYEAEFGSLVAFAGFLQRDSDEVRATILDAFVKQLNS